MLHKFLLFILSLSTTISYSQRSFFDNYLLSENIIPWTLPDSLSEELAVIIKNHTYFSINTEEETDYSLLYIQHKRIYINSDKAIEDNNKIYIDQQGGISYNIYARVIQPDGSIIILDENNIKTGVAEGTENKYSYYAVDGLAIGSELETITKIQKVPSVYGRIFYVQDSYVQFDYLFQYIYPKYLEFGFKEYNSSKIGITDRNDTTRTYRLEYDHIDAKRNEPMSLGDSNLAYLIFKLDKNFYKDLKDINSFGHFSQLLAKRAFSSEINKSEEKQIQKLIDKSGAENADSKINKVLAVENYIKSNFAYIDNNSVADIEELSLILKNKAFNNFGAIKLYSLIFERLGFKSSAVVTCDKSRFKFDEKFENYLFLSKYLLHIKEIDIVIDPTDALSRLHFYNTTYSGHNGLYVTPRIVGGISTAIGRVNWIPESTAEENLTYMSIHVDASSGFDDLKIKVQKNIHGHVASNFIPMFSQVPEEMKEEFYQYVLYTHADDFLFDSVEFENTETDDFPSKPLKQSYDISGNSYWEKAGNSFILKLGKLIGVQSQLYFDDNEERMFDISSPFARKYSYEIIVNLPIGFNVDNIDDIKFNVVEDIDDVDFYFKSDYKLDNGVLTVTIDELYDQSAYPASYFESFRKVINAAADFNKVSLIIKEK